MNYNNISVVIPTFSEPEYLDKCITSIYSGHSIQLSSADKCEVIVVVDGTYSENEEVLTKWKGYITPVIFETTMGQNAATNHGVYNATNEYILIINDDNICPVDWNKILLENYQPRTVVCPNQIEPRDSIFKSFIIHDFGQSTDKFDIKKFQIDEPKYRQNKIQDDGYTLPIFIRRDDYISVGGWDESFPSGLVADLDFFYKCKLNGFSFKRNMKLNFYHFGSVAMNSTEQIAKKKQNELAGFEHFFYKWRKYPKYDKHLNWNFD